MTKPHHRRVQPIEICQVQWPLHFSVDILPTSISTSWQIRRCPLHPTDSHGRYIKDLSLYIHCCFSSCAILLADILCFKDTLPSAAGEWRSTWSNTNSGICAQRFCYRPWPHKLISLSLSSKALQHGPWMVKTGVPAASLGHDPRHLVMRRHHTSPGRLKTRPHLPHIRPQGMLPTDFPANR